MNAARSATAATVAPTIWTGVAVVVLAATPPSTSRAIGNLVIDTTGLALLGDDDRTEKVHAVRTPHARCDVSLPRRTGAGETGVTGRTSVTFHK